MSKSAIDDRRTGRARRPGHAAGLTAMKRHAARFFPAMAAGNAMRVLPVVLPVAALAAALSLIAAGASAGSCYEDLGETGCPDRETFTSSDLERLSCQNLWTVRNGIFAANGYCFKSARGKEQFGNASCSVDDAEQVKMNSHEWANVGNIRAVELAKGCE